MLFCKMNGLGNDYIFVDSELAQLEDVNYLKNSKEIIKCLYISMEHEIMY